MKKALNFCKLFMWGNIGVFTGKALHEYYFYKNNTSWFERNAIPWFSRLRIPFIITVIVTIILIVVRVILKKKIDEKK